MQPHSRIPRLDTYRAVAALAVVYHHFYAGGNPRLNFGLFGIVFFFVLSGYLITNSLQGMSLREFYIRRAFRILPLYYFALFAAVILRVQGDAFWWVAFFLTNIAYAHGVNTGALSHFWTLAIEEQFYLIWPVLLLLAGRSGWLVVAGIGAASVLFRFVTFVPGDARFALYLWGLADPLCIGALLALAIRRFGAIQAELVLRRLLPVGIVGLVGLMTVPGLWRWTVFLLPVACLVFAWLIAIAVRDGPEGNSWGGTILPEIGLMSYGIYVYHFIILSLAGKWWFLKMPLIGIAVTFAVAFVSWHRLEYPMIVRGRELAKPPD